MIALLSDPWLWLVLFAQAAARLAITGFRNPRLFTRLDDIPWPGSRKTPRSGARNDTRSQPRTEPAQGRSRGTTGESTRTCPRAAGAASARGAQPSGRRPDMPMAPRGRHHAAQPLEVRFSVGGEREDGTWAHGGTGPLPRLDDFWTADKMTRQLGGVL